MTKRPPPPLWSLFTLVRLSLLSLLIRNTLATNGNRHHNKKDKDTTDTADATASDNEEPVMASAVVDDDDQFAIQEVYRPPPFVFVIIGIALLGLCCCYLQWDTHRQDPILYDQSLQDVVVDEDNDDKDDKDDNDDEASEESGGPSTETETSSSHQVPEKIHRAVSELELPKIV
jgi:hypothetical protein